MIFGLSGHVLTCVISAADLSCISSSFMTEFKSWEKKNLIKYQ